MNKPEWYTPEYIRYQLSLSDRWVCRAIVALYERQTELEKDTETTRVRNDIGFNAFDAELLTSFAKQLKRRWCLTPKQISIARKRIYKYSKQLADIANQRNYAYKLKGRQLELPLY